MSIKNILLFDMDGVLVESHGYHRALQDTVAWTAEALGYRGVRLTADDIALIESLGISSEWESAAICSAILLDHARREGLDVVLPDRLPDPQPPHGADPPSLRLFFEELGPLADSRSALEDLERRLAASDGRLAGDETLKNLLRSARSPESLTHRTIQALVLGPRAYQQTYGEAPDLEAESYLATYDRSHLSESTQRDLQRWLMTAGNGAVVFTNRPSEPPAGHMDPPEAQIGAELVGLGEAPIVGSGDLGWLALREGKRLYHFLKPSPVHALTALQRAVGADQERALLRALEVEQGQADPEPWRPLTGSRVYAFEDSTKGLMSARGAVELLDQLGVSLELDLIGVSPHPSKQSELEKVTSHVYDDVNQPLEQILTD